ncbi:MAG: hypothetical protein ACRDOK_16315 [Streptosporangiaceae bacterium]
MNVHRTGRDHLLPGCSASIISVLMNSAPACRLPRPQVPTLLGVIAVALGLLSACGPRRRAFLHRAHGGTP